MLDAAKLRKRGVSSVVVAFDTFVTAAQDQARAMSMPDIPLVVIPHLRAGEQAADFGSRAEVALAEVRAALALPTSESELGALRAVARA